jgi:hypothetical protein
MPWPSHLPPSLEDLCRKEFQKQRRLCNRRLKRDAHCACERAEASLRGRTSFLLSFIAQTAELSAGLTPPFWMRDGSPHGQPGCHDWPSRRVRASRRGTTRARTGPGLPTSRRSPARLSCPFPDRHPRRKPTQRTRSTTLDHRLLEHQRSGQHIALRKLLRRRPISRPSSPPPDPNRRPPRPATTPRRIHRPFRHRDVRGESPRALASTVY